MFNDLHNDWLKSLEHRVTVLLYDMKKNQPAVVYFRSALSDEGDLRALAQQLGSQAIQEMMKSAATEESNQTNRVNLLFDAGRVTYEALKHPYRSDDGKFTIEHMVFIPVKNMKTITKELSSSDRPLAGEYESEIDKGNVYWASAECDDWMYRPFSDFRSKFRKELGKTFDLVEKKWHIHP